MKKRLPVSILKYFMHLNIIDFKAEYIEELNLYLLFDIKIDQTIEDRYKLLRSLHPYTFKNKNLIEINSFEQLLDEIDNEHKIFENYMENSNDKIKWYPKVAFKVKKFDLNFEQKINDIINKKLEIKFNSYYDNDGLILTPTNGFREIKVKPKNLMTIDLKYDGKNWLDLENNSYNEIIKEEGEYEHTIYRCYPEKNYYIPKDIRTDKTKANPCNIVNTIIKLYNSKYKHFDFKRLYYHDKEFKSDTYIKKLLSSQRNFLKDMLTKFKSGKYLDLGCANGKIIKLINSNYSYHGIEYDKYQLLQGVTKHNSNDKVNFYHQNLAKSWNIKETDFDYIIANYSLMHFFTEDFWESLDKHVKIGSVFIFNVLNKNSNFEYKNNYIKSDDKTAKIFFDHIHVKEIEENIIVEEKLNYYLSKYNWKIINTTLNNENDLSKLYTWFTCVKIQ